MYEGAEKNTFYRLEGHRLLETGEQTATAPEVLTLASDVIHSIANPLSQPSRALHVYGGTLANPSRSLWNPRSFAQEPFQLSALMKYEQEMNPPSR
jgi:predicted metal-dependent enzyme (double-stranded beta helix superfamily)